MTALTIEELTKSYESNDGEKERVFNGINVTVEDGSFTTVMGPSGCGKSTLLNIVAALVDINGGIIKQDGKAINQNEIEYAYVFQDPRLLEWKTVEENIKFALRAKGIPSDQHDELVEKYLEMVELAGEGDSYPLRLSGGMRQRVGIARALAVESDLVLMDEPFGSLDEITAQKLRDDVMDLWKETGKTVLFVTHNISEAVYMSDKIIFLNDSGEVFKRKIVDVERPRDSRNPELIELEYELEDDLFSQMSDDNG